MSLGLKIKVWLRSDHKAKDLSNFVRGSVLYFLYMNGFSYFLRAKDLDRFAERMKYANPECLSDGECDVCDCSVPAMFMVKDCQGRCKKK